MIVRDADRRDIRAVIGRLRPTDLAEKLAARWSADLNELADELSDRDDALAQYCLAGDDGHAIALVGAFEVMPGVAAVHQAATDRWPEIGRPAHRFYRRRFIPLVLEPTIRLAECMVLPSSVRWVSALGFQPVSPALPYGKQGEEFVRCVWINSRINRDVSEPRTAA